MTELANPYMNMPFCTVCEQKVSGSHYHCGQCHDPRPTSMYGHWHGSHMVGGKFVLVESHFSCTPGACESAVKK
jgi:hypothetical protein